MPSWSIHLKIGKEVLKRIDLDKDKFLFGNLIPDTNYDWKLKRFAAHYYGNLKFPKCPYENMIDFEWFKKDYKDCLDDDLIKGYYAHLLADNFYNEYTYYNKWVQKDNKVVGVKLADGKVINIKDDYKTAQDYKHDDLELFGKRIFSKEEILLPNNSDRIDKAINLLKDKFVSKSNVRERIKYLHSDFIDSYLKIEEEEKNKKYLLYTEEELEDLLEKCIKYVIEELMELNNNE